MKFGQIFRFKYESESKKFIDKNPYVIFVAETKDKIIGINLNYIIPSYSDKIIQFINDKIFKDFSFDEELVETASNRNKIINEKKLTDIILSANENPKLIRMVVEKQKIKNLHRIVSMIRFAMRVYIKNNMKDVISV